MPRRSNNALRDGGADRRGGYRSAVTPAATSAPGWQRQVSTRDGEFLVRSVPGESAKKLYRCPGCQQGIALGTAHIVVWPAEDDGGVADRRHWHTHCWQRRSTRGGPGSPPL